MTIAPIRPTHSADSTAARPSIDPLLALRKGIRVVHEDDGAIRLDLVERPISRLRGLDPVTTAVLDDLGAGRRPPENDESTGGRLGATLRHIEHLLAQAIREDDTVVLLVESIANDTRFPVATLDPAAPLRLSKFAVAARFHDELSVETPVTAARALLRAPGLVGVLGLLGKPVRTAEAVDDLQNLTELRRGTLAEVLGLLVGAGIVEVGDPSDSSFPSDSDEVLTQWEPADLLFHSRSRLGRTDAPFGGRFPYVDTIEPLPAVRELPDGERIALPVPDLSAVRDRDPRLVDVQEARVSTRRYGSAPITLDQLAELLYRTARVRGTYGPRPTAGMPYQGSSRPFPCGGAGYELELYLTVRRCNGLEPGTYYYAPAEHALVLLPTPEHERSTLLATAATSAGGSVSPDVLVTITSRFQRLSWKYQAIAYAVTLKHVGVLYQTLYLVATAMRLAACGLGSGNSEDAARALGLDPLRESSVGEFILGSLPDTADDGPGWNDFQPLQGADWQWHAQQHLLTEGAHQEQHES